LYSFTSVHLFSRTLTGRIALSPFAYTATCSRPSKFSWTC
jgi:hypothetical protein